MPYFAQVDAANVLTVLVVSDDDASRGQEFLADDLGLGGTWIQTTESTRGGVHYGPDGEPDGGTALRYNSASPGHTYDADADAFHAPSPYPSWSLDENYLWQPPTPMPDDGNPYDWDETGQAWIELEP